MNQLKEPPDITAGADAPRRCLFFYRLIGLKVLIFAFVWGVWWIARPRRVSPPPTVHVERFITPDMRLRARAGNPEAVARGEAMFSGSCAECHGSDGRGISGVGSDLFGGPLRHGEEPSELLKNIADGIPAGRSTTVPMPGQSHFNAEELADLVAYLLSNRAPVVPNAH